MFGVARDIVIDREMEKATVSKVEYIVLNRWRDFNCHSKVENQKIFDEVPGLPLEREGEVVKVYFSKAKSHILIR